MRIAARDTVGNITLRLLIKPSAMSPLNYSNHYLTACSSEQHRASLVRFLGHNEESARADYQRALEAAVAAYSAND